MTKLNRIYLASRYSRRLELCEIRKILQDAGYNVQARWLDGKHQLYTVGQPIGDSGEALVESGNCAKAAELRSQFAQDDWEDVCSADLVISFTEPPGTDARRGGRHVEFGIALANCARVIVIGYRENIFHWLPQVEFYETFAAAFAAI